MFILATCNNEDLAGLIGFVKSAYSIIQIAIPIVLLVIGTVDLGKAVMAGDEKEIKAATGMLMKRAGAAVAVFILIYVINLVTGLVGAKDWRDCWKNATTPVGDEEDPNNSGEGDDVPKENGYLNTDMYLL